MRLLIDGNSLGNACQNTQKLYLGDGKKQVQAIFGFAKSLRSILVEERKTHDMHPASFVLWDGRAHWRYELFPLYKGNRDNVNEKVQAEKDAYREQKPDIFRMLKLLGVTQITNPNAEADDLAGFYSRGLSRANENAVLITADKDWIQLVNNNIEWHCYKTKRHVYDKNSLHNVTGFITQKQFLDAKCLGGDSSDNVVGIGGFGDKAIEEFFQRFASVEEFFRLADSCGEEFRSTLTPLQLKFANNETPKPSKKFGGMLPMRDAYFRNLKLMSLLDVKIDRSENVISAGDFDQDGFLDFCHEFNFKSIIADFDNFIKPFIRNS